MIFRRVERRGALVDQRGGKLEQVAARFRAADLTEERLALAHLVGVAQRFEQQPLAAGFERHQLFGPTDRQLPQPDLARRAQRLAQHHEGFLGEIVGGGDVIGLLEIERIDLVGLDELHQLKRLLALDPDRLDFAVLEQHIIALGNLVARDDVVLVDRPDPVGDLFV